MVDVIYLIGIIVFFAVMAGFVKLCDRIIGPDPIGLDADRNAADSRTAGDAADTRSATKNGQVSLVEAA